MFPRIKKITTKNSTYHYLTLSESIRTKGKASTTKDVANLGNINNLPKDSIEKLIDGLIRLFEIEKYALSDQFEILDSVEHGSIIFWQKLWNQLNLGQMITRHLRLKESRIKLEVAKYVEVMVINRCIDPLSKLGATRWLERTCYKYMKGYRKLPLEVEYFYRSMDYLLKIKDELELELFEKMRNLFSVNVKLTFYDITSTFFYSDSCSISENGFSRDDRPDKKQIVIGVVTSYEGYPLKHYVFEGNTKDETTVVDVVNQLKESYHIEDTTFVGDRGMITKLNLKHIENQGFDYIMGVKCRQSEMMSMLFSEGMVSESDYHDYKGLLIQEKRIVIKDFLIWKIKDIMKDKQINYGQADFETLEKMILRLSNDGAVEYSDYKTILEQLVQVKSGSKIRRKLFNLIKKYSGECEGHVRTVVCLNPARKKLAHKKRITRISELSKLLDELFAKNSHRRKDFDEQKKLNSIFEGYKKKFRKFFHWQRDPVSRKLIGYTLDQKVIDAEAKFDGLFILSTSRDDLDPEKVVDSYKNLKEVEMLFDDLKNFVDIHPVRHWLEIRVRAHVFLCILSLLLKRILEINYINGKSLTKLLEEISKSKLVKYKVKYSENENRFNDFLKVTNTTPNQKKYFNMIGVNHPMSLEQFVWC